MIVFFQENGSCSVSGSLTTILNAYSWSGVSNMLSNMLYISLPVGTGFSYREEQDGLLNSSTGVFANSSVEPADGRYPVGDVTTLDTPTKL